MDTERVILIVCITLFVVIGINAAIYAALSRKNTVSQIELIRKAAQQASHPWQTEDDALKELNQRVDQFRGKTEKNE